MKRPLLLMGMAVLFVAAAAMAADDSAELAATKDIGLFYGAPGDMQLVANRGDGGRMDVGRDPSLTDSPDNLLVQHDLSGVVIPGNKQLLGAHLLTHCAKTQGGGFELNILAYPVIDSWVEGTGTTGRPAPGQSGSTGYPWGDAAVGDVCSTYKVISAVTAGVGGTWPSYQVASAGTAWNTVGARGIGTDVYNTLMMDSPVAAPGKTYKGPYPKMYFNATGVSVLQDWIDGVGNTNNGMMVMVDETKYDNPSYPTYRSMLPITTREFANDPSNGADPLVEYAPVLRLEVHLPGDVNDDNAVTIADLQDWSVGYGASNADWADGDVNCDGAVTISDLQVWSVQYGSLYVPSVVPVPEPLTLTLLGVGGLFVIRRKRLA